MTPKPSFTPGPWSVRYDDLTIWDAQGICQIAKTNHPKFENDDENLENAKLIARAPTLLAQRDALLEALTKAKTLLEIKIHPDDKIGILAFNEIFKDFPFNKPFKCLCGIYGHKNYEDCYKAQRCSAAIQQRREGK